jgi:hypothetical protein
VSLILASKKKSLSDSKLSKCIIDVLNDNISNEKIKLNITSFVQQVPFSDISMIHTAEILRAGIFNLLMILRNTQVISTTNDESTGNINVAQL